MKKMLYTGAACACIAAVLCGCGSSSNTAKDSTETETSAETSESGSTSSAEQYDAYSYAYDYADDLAKYIEVSGYKGLTYTITNTDVTDDDVQDYIDNILSQNASPEQITDREVKDGDTVNIDYTGTMDGEEFDGGSSTGYSLEIGSGNFIDGFEDGLIGHKPGEEVTLDLKFPDDYSDTDKAGKDVQFKVTINYIEGDTVTPDFDDDFVKSLGIDNVSTTDEYRDYVRNLLKEENEDTAKSNEDQDLLSALVKNTTVKKYPDEMLSQYKKSYVSYYKQYAEYAGVSLSEFLTSYGSMYGTSATTEDELNEEAEDYAKQATEAQLALFYVTQEENFTVTDDIYKQEIKTLASENNFDNASALESEYGKRYLTNYIYIQKALSILEDNAKGVEETETETETGTETATESES